MPAPRPTAQFTNEPADFRPIKLKDEAFAALERLIVNGVLAPGRWVSETDLIEISGHTRASVRSAVQRLEDQQLIQIFPRRGAQICPVDYTRQFRALELRRVVERLIARSAAKRATETQRARFNEIAEGFRTACKSKDQNDMTELDSENYSLMVSASDNPFAAKAMSSVKGLSRRFWVLHQEAHGDIDEMANSYAAVAAAIAAGDVDVADQAVSHLIDYVEKFTLEVVGYSAGHNPAG